MLVLLGVVIINIGSVFRSFKQTIILGYILASIVIGKHGMWVLTDEKVIHTLGEFGLILLLFVNGMEINLPNLIKNWKVPLVGTLSQVVGIKVLVACLDWLYNSEIYRLVVLAFIVSLSSTSDINILLHGYNEFHIQTGQNVINFLLMQEILIF